MYDFSWKIIISFYLKKTNPTRKQKYCAQNKSMWAKKICDVIEIWIDFFRSYLQSTNKLTFTYYENYQLDELKQQSKNTFVFVVYEVSI